MQLDSIKNNSILIVPSNIHKKVITYFSNEKNILNVKVMSFEMLESSLFYSFNTLSINYVMNTYKVNYDVAITYLNSLKYRNNQYCSSKLDFLNKLYVELDKNNLLIKDINFINLLKNKSHLYVYGYDIIDKYQQYMLDIVSKYTDVIILDKKKNNYEHSIYKLATIDKELSFVFESICSLLNKGIKPTNIYLSNINDDYIKPIKRMSKFYNLKIKIDEKKKLYQTEIGKYFIANLDLNKEELLDNIKNKLNNDIYSSQILKLVVNFMNEFYWLDKLSDAKYLVIKEFKKVSIPTKKYTNEIVVTDIIDNIFSNDDYVFLLNFNLGEIPATFKDEDYISDDLKPHFANTSDDLNKLLKDKYLYAIKNIKNLIITYKVFDSIKTNKISYLNNYLNYPEEVIDFNISNYSNIINQINLTSLLDNYELYNVLDKDIDPLLNNYQIEYKTYKNDFTNINNELLIDTINKKVKFSYSNINSYFSCPFKFYANYILSLSKNEKNFKSILGTFYHYVLEGIDNNSIDELKDTFLANLDISLSNKELFFISKSVNDLKVIIELINKQYSHIKYNKVLKEEKIEITLNRNIDVKMVGYIDKILLLDNQALIIDYKTNKQDINPDYFEYGINLQLPIYLYLLKKNNPNIEVKGIFLQHLIDDKGIKDEHSIELTLRLDGIYKDTITDLEVDSFKDIIRNMNSKTNKYCYTKEDLEQLYNLTSEKINECIDNITAGEFKINPIIIDDKVNACAYCEFKDICFKQYKDIKIISTKKEEERE